MSVIAFLLAYYVTGCLLVCWLVGCDLQPRGACPMLFLCVAFWPLVALAVLISYLNGLTRPRPVDDDTDVINDYDDGFELYRRIGMSDKIERPSSWKPE